MAEIKLRLSKAECDAMQQPRPYRTSAARRSAEFKLRNAIWRAYPELRETQYQRDEREAYDDNHHRNFRDAVLGRNRTSGGGGS